jgi:hypothetical protein
MIVLVGIGGAFQIQAAMTIAPTAHVPPNQHNSGMSCSVAMAFVSVWRALVWGERPPAVQHLGRIVTQRGGR